MGIGDSPTGAAGTETETATVRAEDMKWAFRLDRDKQRKTVKAASEVAAPGDVIYFEPSKGEDGVTHWHIRSPPKSAGPLVPMKPHPSLADTT